MTRINEHPDQIAWKRRRYVARVAELEAEGLTTSDAQAAADAEQTFTTTFTIYNDGDAYAARQQAEVDAQRMIDHGAVPSQFDMFRLGEERDRGKTWAGYRFQIPVTFYVSEIATIEAEDAFDEIDELRDEIVSEARAVASKANYWLDRERTDDMTPGDLRDLRRKLVLAGVQLGVER